MLRPDIGLVGRKRVGKDTAARHLARTYDYRPLGFADALRQAVEALDPIVDYSPCRGVFRYRQVVAAHGYEAAKDRHPEVRRVLQNYGLGLRQTLGEDVWVEALVRRLPGLSEEVPAAVTDVRFPNEVEGLRERGFILVRLTRDTGLEDDPHPSEAFVDTLPVDYEVDNDGTPEDLFAHLDRIVLEHSL
jgi:hypothetical protein